MEKWFWKGENISSKPIRNVISQSYKTCISESESVAAQCLTESLSDSESFWLNHCKNDSTTLAIYSNMYRNWLIWAVYCFNRAVFSKPTHQGRFLELELLTCIDSKQAFWCELYCTMTAGQTPATEIEIVCKNGLFHKAMIKHSRFCNAFITL